MSETPVKHRDVALLIPIEGDRFLLQDRRSIHKEVYLEWGFFGGGIEPGESAEEAVLRESREELGWAPVRVEFIGRQSVLFGDILADQRIFACDFPGFDAIKILEGSGAELVTVAEARTRKTFAEPVLDVIERYLRER